MPPSDRPTPPAASPPALGLPSAVALVVASMIGAVVFTSSGFALGDLGSPRLVILVWVIGGIVALAGAISYGALAQSIEESGGEYTYLARRVHPLAGFLAGWVSLLAGFTASMAFAAGALESYLAPLVGLEGVMPPGTLAVVSILLAAAVHSWHFARGASLQNVVVLLKVAGLVAMVVIGCVLLGQRPPLEQPAAPAPFPGWLAIANQLTWVALGYAGFNAAIYVAEEVRDARRNVPRAMLIGTLLVMFLYVALNAVFVHSGPVGQLANSPDIAAVAARLLGGAWAEVAVRVLICAALLTSVSALSMAGPRVYAKMAQDGLFPLPVSSVDGTVRGAIWLQAALAIAVVLSTPLRTQLDYLGFTLSLSAAATVASLLLPRGGPPLGIVRGCAAALFVVATLTFALLAAARDTNQSALYGGATLLSGILVYHVLRRACRH